MRDSLDREAVQAVTVAVLDPDSVFPGESTFCFANAGDTGATFSGCPAGARRMGGVTGLASLQPHVAPGRRLLLRRGDTFAADADALLIDVRGPGLLGAFGSGNRPVLAPSAPVSSGCADGNPGTLCASVEMVKLSDENLGPDPYASDWRVMDLQSDGTARPDLRLVGVGGSADNLLLLRLRAVGLGNGINGAGAVDFWNRNGDADQKGHDVPDVFAVQECELRDVTGGEGHNLMAGAGRRVMYLGNLFRNSNGGEHVMRLFWTERGVLSHNDIGDAAAGRSVLKMHAGKFNDSSSTAFRKYTEKVVITGDAMIGWTPFMGDGYPEEWAGTLDRLAQLDFTHIIMGHGNVAGREWLATFRSYVHEMVEAVRQEAATGASLDEVKQRVSAKLAPRYEKPFSAYGDYRPWRTGVLANIERTFAMVS